MNESAKELPPATVGAAVDWAGDRLDAADLHYGHGADNPYTEAIILLTGLTDWPLERVMDGADLPLTTPQRERLAELVEERIVSRRPAAYLVQRAWFAGLEFYVDERVLVPRSPLAEPIAEGLYPWLERERVTRVLDLGTGSGCLAIACAQAFPNAQVDAVDVDGPALEVARINVARHAPDGRVRLLESDLFASVDPQACYDLIVSNPPYVARATVDALPPEYLREPRLALESGEDGLDAVRAILRDAPRFLAPGGVLLVEVGESDEALAEAFPEIPFLWLEFSQGGEGVFLLTAGEGVGPGKKQITS